MIAHLAITRRPHNRSIDAVECERTTCMQHPQPLRQRPPRQQQPAGLVEGIPSGEKGMPFAARPICMRIGTCALIIIINRGSSNCYSTLTVEILSTRYNNLVE